MSVMLTGFLTCLALIVAIGAQTLFLLRQIVRRDRPWAALGVCFLGDAVMLSLGAAGIGVVAERWPWLVPALTAAGVVYLVWFALSALRSAARGERTLESAAVGTDDDGLAPSGDDVAALTGRLPVLAPASAPSPARAEDGRAPEASGGVALATRTAVRTAPVQAAPPQTPLPRLVLLALSVSLLNPHAILDTVVMMGTVAQTYGEGKWLFTLGAVAASAAWFVVLGWGGATLAPLMNSPRTWRVVDAAVGVLMLGIAVKVGLTLL